MTDLLTEWFSSFCEMLTPDVMYWVGIALAISFNQNFLVWAPLGFLGKYLITKITGLQATDKSKVIQRVLVAVVTFFVVPLILISGSLIFVLRSVIEIYLYKIEIIPFDVVVIGIVVSTSFIVGRILELKPILGSLILKGSSLSELVFSSDVKSFNSFIRKRYQQILGFRIEGPALLDILDICFALWCLIRIDYFSSIPWVRYFLIMLYLLMLLRIWRRQAAMNRCLNASTSQEQLQWAGVNDYWLYTHLPIFFFLGNKILFYVAMLPMMFNLIMLAYGILDIGHWDLKSSINSVRRRDPIIIQVSIYSVLGIYLVMMPFTLASCFFLFALFAGSPFFISLMDGLRSIAARSFLSVEYFSTVTGEFEFGRAQLYGALRNRVVSQSGLNFSEIGMLKLKPIEYVVYFHSFNTYIYGNSDVVTWREHAKGSIHAILVFNKENSYCNVLCESDFMDSLKRPLCSIDCFLVAVCLDKYNGGSIPALRHEFLWYRIELIQRMTDESFNHSEAELRTESNLLQRRVHTEAAVLRSDILQLSSFEAVRLNIRLLYEFISEADKDSLEVLQANGIFEINTLFRQLHESPSIPSRFIDLLNVAECTVRYVCGICHATRISDGARLDRGIKFDAGKIAFGTCNSFLGQWRKLESNDFPDTVMGRKIDAYLDEVYSDAENVQVLAGFIRQLNPGVKVKYAAKPTVMELFGWMAFIRNKTRGHGTPSKVDFRFYASLEKAVLFLVSEFAKLGLKPGICVAHESYNWTVDLSNGGLPVVVPVVKDLDRSVHFNARLTDSEIDAMISRHKEILEHHVEGEEVLHILVPAEGKQECWRCDDHFKIKDGIVHLLNERSDKRESWISFSTGSLLRPEIVEA